MFDFPLFTLNDNGCILCTCVTIAKHTRIHTHVPTRIHTDYRVRAIYNFHYISSRNRILIRKVTQKIKYQYEHKANLIHVKGHSTIVPLLYCMLRDMQLLAMLSQYFKGFLLQPHYHSNHLTTTWSRGQCNINNNT